MLGVVFSYPTVSMATVKASNSGGCWQWHICPPLWCNGITHCPTDEWEEHRCGTPTSHAKNANHINVLGVQPHTHTTPTPQGSSCGALIDSSQFNDCIYYVIYCNFHCTKWRNASHNRLHMTTFVCKQVRTPDTLYIPHQTLSEINVWLLHSYIIEAI